MKRHKYIFLSYLFVTVLGVLLHFLYDWSGQNPVVGIFSAVNESTWEHLKLIFFPFLLLTLWEFFTKHQGDNCFLPARLAGILSAMAFTVIAFYTYSGVLGKNVDIVNISIFFLAVVIGFWTEKKVYGKAGLLSQQMAASVFLVILFLFFIFTFTPPDIGLFEDPDAASMKTFFFK